MDEQTYKDALLRKQTEILGTGGITDALIGFRKRNLCLPDVPTPFRGLRFLHAAKALYHLERYDELLFRIIIPLISLGPDPHPVVSFVYHLANGVRIDAPRE